MGPVRAAIPAFGCDGLLCRGFRLFRHIDRQAPLVGYLRHAVAALDVDREFLFGDAAVAVIHHHGDLGINHIRRTQVLYRVESIIQLETVGTGFFVDIEGAVVGLVDVFAVYLAHRPITRSLQGIGQRIAVHIRGQGIARDRLVRTFLDGQHRLVQRQHRSVVGTVDGDGNGLCHFRTILVLDEDGEGIRERGTLSQLLYRRQLVVELVMVVAVRIDEERSVLTGSHRLAFASRIPGGHVVAQIVRAISPVVRDLELLLVCEGHIFLDLQRGGILDLRRFVGAFDGDVDRVRSGTVPFAVAIIHGDLQVESFRIASRQLVGDMFIGLEGIAAVLLQREFAQDRSVLLDRIGTGPMACVPIIAGQCDTLAVGCDLITEVLRSLFLTAHVHLIGVRGLDLACIRAVSNGLTRILDLQIRDRFDDRPVIDALDGHIDGDFPTRCAHPELQIDHILFSQPLDRLTAVVEHEAVAPLARCVLFQDQRAVVGLDHMGPVAIIYLKAATIIQQPDLIGIDRDRLIS